MGFIDVDFLCPADANAQALVDFIEVNQRGDHVLSSPPGAGVQVVAQEDAFYRLGLVFSKFLKNGFGRPEVNQRAKRDEFTGEMLFVTLVPGACAVLSEDVKHHNVMLTGIRPPTLGEAAVLQYRARALVH